MSAKPNYHVIELNHVALPGQAPQRAELLAITEDGGLLVRTSDGAEFICDWLESPNNSGIRLEPGDRLLCAPPCGTEPGIVIGRIGRYREPKIEANITIQAEDSLTLKCGEASLELRGDGRSILKGEDVLLRAKRTQRIRAATVAIN